MQKTINIALQGTQFTLEEPAYEKLHAYLESLKTHFANYQEQSDIIADIEGRVVEHLSERVQKESVGSLADIDALIAEMGSAEDLSEFEGGNADTGTVGGAEKPPKKLYRDVDTAIIGGVCSGIAAYFSVDVTVVRILFAVGIFVTGVSLPLYLVMWLVVPAARSQADKLRMKGLQVNVSTLERQRTNSDSVPEKRTSRIGLWVILGILMVIMIVPFLFFSFFSISNIETDVVPGIQLQTIST